MPVIVSVLPLLVSVSPTGPVCAERDAWGERKPAPAPRGPLPARFMAISAAHRSRRGDFAPEEPTAARSRGHAPQRRCIISPAAAVELAPIQSAAAGASSWRIRRRFKSAPLAQ